MEKTADRSRVRSNRYTPDASHCGAHFSSRPSSAGFSGTEIGCFRSTPSAITRTASLPVRRFDSIDFLAHEALGYVDDRLAHILILEPIDDTADDVLDDV